MNDKIRQILLQLKKDGLMFLNNGMLPANGTCLDFSDHLFWYEIAWQGIPNVPNWRQWCGKLKECGVKFEYYGGGNFWKKQSFDFDGLKHDYQIPKQPVPETIANYLNKEKTMSENAIKPKSFKIQLPEIEVSGDVASVEVSILDTIGRCHNTAGLSQFEYRVRSNGLVLDSTTVSYHIHGAVLTKEDFERAIQPPKELTIQEVEKLLGYKVKIVGDKK